MDNEKTVNGENGDAKFVVTGRMAYQSLGTGFWGFIAEDGGEYRPVATADELQSEGLRVSITAKAAANSVSIFMWGKPIDILDFDLVGESSSG